VSPESGTGERDTELGPLVRLRDEPARSAIFTDVDGTLAPIVPRPEDAAVPARASELLARLSERYGLVGCVSGRQAEEARRLVGVAEIAYAGNHGLELLLPGEDEPRFDPALRGREDDAKRFLAESPVDLDAAGLRREDKGPIQALHWRGAAEEQAAEAHAHELAAAAGRAGLELRWGRKVLELRPPGGGGKDGAVAALLSSPQKLDRAVYAGDDRTDLDAFRRLRELRADGELESAVCVGVTSAEGPAEIGAEADLTVNGPEGWLALLEALAG